ncbi:MAG TPA: hypothetical protein VHJ59_07755 [Nitrososphaera sp.]|nr:hypothetical protein [Nitrososphaera sp.]
MTRRQNNNNNNNKILLLDNIHLVTAATIFILAIIFASSMTTTPPPVAASTTGINNTTTTTTPSSGLELSPQPIWQERVATTGVTPINETHSIVDFDGNGTMTVPDTGETINMTNNGTAIISPVTGSADTISAYGRENVFSEDDDDTTAITFYEIVQYQPEPFQGKGLVIAVFDRNATGSLAPFNGMMVVGTHEEDPNAAAATITLWEWQGGIPLLLPTTNTATTTTEEPLLMNTTTATTTNATTTADTSATTTAATAAEEEGEQQTTTIPTPLLE